MDLMELNQAIGKHQLNNLYIFTGEEINLMNLYVRQLGEYKRVDTVLEVWSKLTSNGKFVKPEFKTYVVRDDMEFLKNEKAWSNVSRIKNGRLVLLYTDIKKTLKFYKHFKDIIVEFKHLTPTQLYLQLEQNPKYSAIANVNKNILEYFIESCNNDLNTIDNEVDKYIRLKDSGVVNTFDKNTIDILITPDPKYNVFQLIDLIMGQDLRAVEVLQYLVDHEPNLLGILTLLYANIRRAILVAGNPDFNKTGLPYWQYKNIKDKCKISPNKLLHCLRVIQEYDSGIKKGKYGQVDGVQSCVLKLLI